ncbi:hypothetical protein CCAND95_50045 [Capnocytophaga canis]|nr:hypothetical protein CCAND95_50045 [Capnocytophaga canis]
MIKYVEQKIIKQETLRYKTLLLTESEYQTEKCKYVYDKSYIKKS